MVGPFDKNLHEGSIWTVHTSVIYFILHKSIFIHFVHHGTIFYEKYIISDDRKKYMDDDGSGVFSKHKVRKLYNAKYQKTYSNQYYVLKNDHIKRYKNTLDMFRNKTKGDRLCVSKRFTIS